MKGKRPGSSLSILTTGLLYKKWNHHYLPSLSLYAKPKSIKILSRQSTSGKMNRRISNLWIPLYSEELGNLPSNPSCTVTEQRFEEFISQTQVFISTSDFSGYIVWLLRSQFLSFSPRITVLPQIAIMEQQRQRMHGTHILWQWRHTNYIERCEGSESIINLHKTGLHNTRKINEMN